MNGAAMYAATQDRGQDELVTRHAPLVKRIAYHLMSRLPPSVQADDLIQAGMIGLLEAARNYDPSQGASFETYAGIRIRGSMLDEIRRTDWTPRSVHRKARQVAEAVREIENSKGRDARDHEVAELLGIDINEYHRILQDATGARMFSFDDPGSMGEDREARGREQSNEPLDNLQNEDFQKALSEAIAGLPERERLVMALYYDEELNLREIGEVLGVSESRICQIHGQALIRLRARMGEWTGG
ncbi:RNA polymerase sigma factor FliA [Thiohalobacter sp. IOR34]|uniref:RNA polymerase sigma factor FliA n=1 Tax=Thiohalobacter sp. IOR34 TaxID=3057176 RepID=UPI0025AF6C2C|nr:RNA polymerase sigma factor FliA [Thiohalobacter sp. IOR34]WJW74559.1 RNA polymerase sigma factor FliA [Thiohalobacter sp. IOR34]